MKYLSAALILLLTTACAPVTNTTVKVVTEKDVKVNVYYPINK